MELFIIKTLKKFDGNPIDLYRCGTKSKHLFYTVAQFTFINFWNTKKTMPA